MSTVTMRFKITDKEWVFGGDTPYQSETLEVGMELKRGETKTGCYARFSTELFSSLTIPVNEFICTHFTRVISDFNGSASPEYRITNEESGDVHRLIKEYCSPRYPAQ